MYDGVETRGSKDKRETEDNMEKDRRQGVEQVKVTELECSQSGSIEQGGLVRQRDGVVCAF